MSDFDKAVETLKNILENYKNLDHGGQVCEINEKNTDEAIARSDTQAPPGRLEGSNGQPPNLENFKEFIKNEKKRKTPPDGLPLALNDELQNKRRPPRGRSYRRRSNSRGRSYRRRSNSRERSYSRKRYYESDNLQKKYDELLSDYNDLHKKNNALKTDNNLFSVGYNHLSKKYSELLKALRNNTYKTENCIYETRGGKCRNGNNCFFIHPDDISNKQTMVFYNYMK
jgi:hypothetical protein